MSQTVSPMAAERLASLGRAVIEFQQAPDSEHQRLDEAWQTALSEVPEEQREAVFTEAETLLSAAAGTERARPTGAAADSKGPTQELLQKCAGLDLKLQTEVARYAELETALRREQDNHKEAIESLSLQQQKIKELQEGRAKLMEDLTRVENQLRLQLNETEQVQLKYEKLKSSRSTVGDQITEQTEQINALKAENEQLRTQVEATLRDRDRKTADAQAETEAAEGRTAEAAFRLLWGRMNKELPTLFVETHVPNLETFERSCDALVEFVRVFATLERHVHQMLRDLRQVGEEGDKLNRFHILLTKNPGLVETLGDHLISGKRKGNYANLLRAVQAWARAFGTGLYKVIVKSPTVIGNELNYRSWPVSRGRFETEEASIGKYFKETVHRNTPDKLGNQFRKHAANEAYEDYNALMRRK